MAKHLDEPTRAEIREKLSEGKSYKQIASELGVSYSTVYRSKFGIRTTGGKQYSTQEAPVLKAGVKRNPKCKNESKLPKDKTLDTRENAAIVPRGRNGGRKKSKKQIAVVQKRSKSEVVETKIIEGAMSRNARLVMELQDLSPKEFKTVIRCAKRARVISKVYNAASNNLQKTFRKASHTSAEK